MRQILAAMAAALLALAAPARADPERVAPNVFVVSDPDASATTFWMIVKAGCRDEAHGQCRGLAHYLEHLIFLGRNPDHAGIAMRFFPDGEANGYTNHVSTVFWQRFPLRAGGQRDDLEKLFRFYSDHLRRLEVSETEAARERGVVLQEYNIRVARNPPARFFAVLNRKLHPNHPQGQLGIGLRSDIEAFTLASALEFHSRWYVRDNVAFVVHGPVSADDVRALAQTYVAPLPATRPPERAWLDSLYDFTPITTFDRIPDKDARQRLVAMQRLVRYEETDRRRASEARDIVNAFLRSNLPGSPREVLVEEQAIAIQVSFVEVSRVTAGMLNAQMTVQPKDGVGDEAALAAVNAYLARLAARGMDATTVERLRLRSRDQRALWAKEPERVAQGLVGWLAAHNSYDDFLQREKQAADVTTEDVNAVIRVLARPGRQVSGALAPTAP